MSDSQRRYIRFGAVMYVVLTEREKQKPYGELLSTAECITL
jgi:hypothetical protein